MVNIVVWCVLPLHKFSFEIFSLLFGFYDVHEARGSATNCRCRMNLIRFFCSLLLLFIFYSFGLAFFFSFVLRLYSLSTFFSLHFVLFIFVHLRFKIMRLMLPVHTFMLFTSLALKRSLVHSEDFFSLSLERNKKREKKVFFIRFCCSHCLMSTFLPLFCTHESSRSRRSSRLAMRFVNSFFILLTHVLLLTPLFYTRSLHLWAHRRRLRIRFDCMR